MLRAWAGLLSQAGKPNKIAGVKERGTKDTPFFTPIRTTQSTDVRYIAGSDFMLSINLFPTSPTPPLK
jgi:hypothetical protein